MRKGKTKSPWLTRNQLQVLQQIARAGRRGILLWFTDINIATIRSLSKRGYVDTRSRGRVVATRAGKRRLNEPWPPEQPTADQKPVTRSGGEAAAVIGAPVASGEASALTGSVE